MWDMIKDWLAWVYNWITVLTSTIIGALAFLPDILNSLDLFHLTAVLEPNTAAMIIVIVGILKGLAAAIASKKSSA